MNKPTPFFATKTQNRAIVVKTGVRAGLAESGAKAREEASK